MQKRINDITPQEWDNMNRDEVIGKSFGGEQILNNPSLKAGVYAQFDARDALDKQVGGDHYKKFKIQPAEFCYKNNIPYLEATAIKYLCRWRDKGGMQDLDKAIHFIELLKEFESADD